MTHWTEISPKDAAEQNIDCTKQPELNPPRNENGDHRDDPEPESGPR